MIRAKNVVEVLDRGCWHGTAWWDVMPIKDEDLVINYCPIATDELRTFEDVPIGIGRVTRIVRAGSGQRGVPPKGATVYTVASCGGDPHLKQKLIAHLEAMGFERDDEA